MWFAFLSCLLACALVLYSHRAARRIRSAKPVERVCRELRGYRVGPAANAGEQESDLREVVHAVERARNRAEAVAALNEFTLEAEAGSESEVEIPGLLARVCFTLGLLFGVLALTEMLGAPEVALSHQLAAAGLAVAFGVVGGMVCYRIGREAKQRRRDYRNQVRQLSKILQDRLPPDSSAVGSHS